MNGCAIALNIDRTFNNKWLPIVTLGKHWQLTRIIKISKQKISKQFTKKKIQLFKQSVGLLQRTCQRRNYEPQPGLESPFSFGTRMEI